MDGDIDARLGCISHGYTLSGFIASGIGSHREELHLPKIDVAIVEDDDSVREATKHLLRLLGYATASFASAENFLRSGRVRDTACLITDVCLPGMSGVELQSRLILDGHRMPIIFITAFPEEAIRARVLRNGALGYLSKPLQEQSLITCLDQALKRPRQDPV
jgi:FixJ family two-component response regulator